jgi:Cu/Ag efflux pump CusA
VKLFRRLGLTLMMALGALALPPAINTYAAAPPSVSLDVRNAGPRQVEDTTERAVSRDYAVAWQAMAEALKQNRTDVLGANFIGNANEKLVATIEDQRKNGLHQEIVDRGHQVDAIFYSPEGSAMELHDTAQVQLQLMDGNKVVHSQDATIHYVVLLTAAENSWKVRVLEAVPSF